MTLEEIYKQLASQNVATAGGLGGTRQAVAYWSSSTEPSILPTQWGEANTISVGTDYAAGPELTGFATYGGIRDDRFTRAEIDDARKAATEAERARIIAVLETCRPTDQPYTRRDWAIEEKGRRAQFDKMMKALGQSVKEGE